MLSHLSYFVIQLSHQAQNRFKVHFFPGLALDPAPNAANAIGLFALFLTFHNQIRQPLVLRSPFLPLSPCIISASTHLEDLAHGLDAVLPAEAFDDSILQLHLLPAPDRKFRSNSTCIRSFTSSLCCLTSSLAASLRGRPLGRGTYPAVTIRSFRF